MSQGQKGSHFKMDQKPRAHAWLGHPNGRGMVPVEFSPLQGGILPFLKHLLHFLFGQEKYKQIEKHLPQGQKGYGLETDLPMQDRDIPISVSTFQN